MRVTQNSDGSLSVEISNADLQQAAAVTLGRIPVSNPDLYRQLVFSLSDDFAAAIRAANVVFDQALTDTVAQTVQVLASTRADAVAAVEAAAKVGP
jgi:hypothetical protein